MLDNLLKWSINVLLFIASVALCLMILVVVADVVGRNVLNSPLTGAYELVEFLMGILCPVSVVYCISRNEDISVDLFYQHMSVPWRKGIMLSANLFVTATTLLLFWQSCYLIEDIVGMDVSTALLGIDMWPIAVLVMLSFLIMLPIEIKYLLRSFRTVDEEENDA